MRIMKDGLWSAGFQPAFRAAGILPAGGFALILSLLLVLILTIFAYWMLLLVQNHYSSTKMLFDSDNARTISEAAAFHLVQQHNTQVPRFFADPQHWNQLQMQPFTWNNYAFSGSLPAPWDSVAVNLFTLRAQKARSLAEMQLPLRQIRLEDFALFSDTQQHLNTSTLFDGFVFVRSGLTLNGPALFRAQVHNEVAPSNLATYRRKTSPWIDFPSLDTLIPAGWKSGGFTITAKDPRFWQSDHYELDLDQLVLTKSGDAWKVKYKNNPLGDAANLILIFDDNLHIHQTYRELPHLPSPKPDAPLYIASNADILLKSDIQRFEGGENEHGICLISANTIHVLPEKSSARIEACLFSSGKPSLHVDTGSLSLSDVEKQSWISEIQSSVFLMEPAKKKELLEALNKDEKIVWLRGTVGVQGPMSVAPDIIQLHFEACRRTHPLFISFPFVQVVEGMEKWR
ncbi:hypothetical protein L0156_13705 [bacterium]|nr:hypothetical protein [bacterium]